MNAVYEPTDAECVNPWRDDTDEEELVRAVRDANLKDQPQPPPAIETYVPTNI